MARRRVPANSELVSSTAPALDIANKIPKVVGASASNGFGRMVGGRFVPTRSRGIRGLDGAQPTIQRNVDILVFDDFVLGTDTGFASSVTSDPFPMYGNAVGAGLTIVNISDSALVTLTLEGSVNRRTWLLVGAVACNTFQYVEQLFSGVKYAWLRVRAELTGSVQIAKFDAGVCFSKQ